MPLAPVGPCEPLLTESCKMNGMLYKDRARGLTSPLGRADGCQPCPTLAGSEQLWQSWTDRTHQIKTTMRTTAR